jgi:hypothetical protein
VEAWTLNGHYRLAHQVDDGRDGAEEVVLLDMELEASFVHPRSYRGRDEIFLK